MRNKDIKIIFVDIDWTLYDHKAKKWDTKSIKALKKCQKRGYKVVVNTARPYHSAKQFGVFDMFKPDGYIVCNGGLVVMDDKIIYQNKLSKEDLYKVCEVVLARGRTMECFTKDDAFLIAPENEYVHRVFDIYYEDMPEVRDYHNQEVIACAYFGPVTDDHDMKKSIPSHLHYSRYTDSGVDISTMPHLKGDGVDALLAHLNIDKKHTISFGDDYGDIHMFEHTGIGVAMGNGKAEVKQAATFVSKEVWNHGVYYGLKQFKLI